MYVPYDTAAGAVLVEPRTLTERLERAGMRTIPIEKIDEHKRQTADAVRVGIWHWLHPIPRAYVALMEPIRFNPVIAGIALLTLMVFFGWLGHSAGAMIGWPVAPSVVGALLGFGAFVALLAFDESLYCSPAGIKFLDAGQYWMKDWYTIHEYPRGLPDHLKRRLKVLRGLVSDSAAIFVERFGCDPLLGVDEYGHIVYIGAWDTGTELDNY